jgi:murein DD-endopeptidase MepM/ murein hydrolase activator NlpD
LRRLLLLALAPTLLGAAKPAPVASDPKQETSHTVVAGETLGGIAQRSEVPRILIIEANGLKEPYLVREGQVLVIPRRRSHTVKAGETGFAIAMDYGVPWSAIAVANGLDPKTRVRTGQKLVIPTMSKATVAEAADDDEADERTGPAKVATPPKAAALPMSFVWPAPGKVRRGFAPRGAAGAHDGIDITGKKGDPARAAAPCLVWFAGKEPNLYGNVVILDHGKGWFSAYAKLSKVTVKKGEQVRSGERVGLIGNTGATSTTELHFEIRRKTVPQNPVKLLPRRD